MLAHAEAELENSRVDLETVSGALEDLTEALGQIDDGEAAAHVQEQDKTLRSVAHTLQRVLKERQILFRAASSGRLDKDVVEPICAICREFESQYALYHGLKEQCAQLERACRV